MAWLEELENYRAEISIEVALEKKTWDSWWEKVRPTHFNEASFTIAKDTAHVHVFECVGIVMPILTPIIARNKIRWRNHCSLFRWLRKLRMVSNLRRNVSTHYPLIYSKPSSLHAFKQGAHMRVPLLSSLWSCSTHIRNTTMNSHCIL